MSLRKWSSLFFQDQAWELQRGREQKQLGSEEGSASGKKSCIKSFAVAGDALMVHIKKEEMMAEHVDQTGFELRLEHMKVYGVPKVGPEPSLTGV